MDPSEEPEDDGVCGVCGGVLGPPLATCPACSTLHHQDCWNYNGGCAIYGCGATDAPLAVALAARDEGAPTRDGPDPVTALGLMVGGLVLFLWIVQLLLPPLWSAALGLFLGLTVWSRYQALERAREDAVLLAPPDDQSQLALEVKAVLARLGDDSVHDLAQAYALFEQRRPRDRLPLEAQRALSLELVEGGYRVLAAESLEKCFAAAPEDPQVELREAYRDLFRPDPAFLEEATGKSTAEISRLVLDVRPLLTGRPQYLLALPQPGFPVVWRRPYRLPTEADEAEIGRTFRVAGPFPPEELAEHLSRLAGLGCPAVPVTPEELALPGAIETVVHLSLTSKGARLDSEAREQCFPWSEVRAVVCERIERVETHQVMKTEVTVGHRGARSTSYRNETREDRRYDSVLEIHAGEPLQRFRLDGPGPDLFTYLGRRRELAYETNLRFAAKDLIRFAPRARASRGVVAMLSERQIGEVPLTTRRELEETVLWFHGLGVPRVRAWWASQPL